jgi:tRNA nucleotidyltransferase (CCA-adding enzyme)
MKVYVVGGAVRDKLLGVESKDVDWVVIGSTPEDMVEKGFRPVGTDFPIYIGPDDGQEYALARRSRLGGQADFGPEVTLEEDLRKRDLTINAMAVPIEDGMVRVSAIVDPYFGRDDLFNKVLRMVSREAFEEDPIRVLRVARFAARYPDFRIDRYTMDTMRIMTSSGKLDNLVPERVWKELARGLMEDKPSRMLQVLRECGALKVILPEVDALYGVPQPAQWHPEIDTGVHTEQVIDYAASQNFDLDVRWACLLHDLGKALTAPEKWPSHHGHESSGVFLVHNVSTRLNVPSRIALVAMYVTEFHGVIHGAMKVKTTTIVRTLRRCDAFRNPVRFNYVLQAALCDARGRHSDTLSFRDVAYPQAQRFSNALWAAKQVKGHDIAARCQGRPEYIAVEMHAARARAIKAFERQQKETT